MMRVTLPICEYQVIGSPVVHGKHHDRLEFGVIEKGGLVLTCQSMMHVECKLVHHATGDMNVFDYSGKFSPRG